MEECKDIMVIDWATRIPTDAEEEYLSHLFCLGGGCWYRFNGMDFELHAGDLSIIRKRKMIENIEVSMDFCAKIIYVKSGFVELCNLRAIMEWKDNWPFPQLCHQNLIRFHGCTAVNDRGRRLDKYQSLTFLSAKAEEYKNGEGWRLLAVLKKMLADNNINIKKKMAAWRKK